MRRRREGQPLETQGGCGSGGVHEQIDGVKSAAEERNAEVLTALYHGTNAEDDAAARERTAKDGHRKETDAEKEDEGERKDEVDQVAGDESAKWAGVVRPCNEMERSHADADDDDDGLAWQVE